MVYVFIMQFLNGRDQIQLHCSSGYNSYSLCGLYGSIVDLLCRVKGD